MNEMIAAIRLFLELWAQIKSLYAFHEQNKNELWYKKSFEVFNALENAKTVDEKKAAIRGLADLWDTID